MINSHTSSLRITGKGTTCGCSKLFPTSTKTKQTLNDCNSPTVPQHTTSKAYDSTTDCNNSFPSSQSTITSQILRNLWQTKPQKRNRTQSQSHLNCSQIICCELTKHICHKYLLLYLTQGFLAHRYLMLLILKHVHNLNISWEQILL